MGDCPIGFTADDKRRLDKLYVDVYEGRDSDNPSVTARLAALEKESDTVTSVKIALFGDEDHEGLILKFERTIGLVRGSLWAASIAGFVGMALFTWALSQVVPAAKIILDDYYSHHPAARQSLVDPQNASNHTQANKW